MTNKLRDVKHTVKHFQLRDTMVLINVLLKVFSLDSAARRITKEEKCRCLFKCVLSVVIIGCADVYSLHWKINNIFSFINPSISITDVVQMAYDYMQYIIDLVFIYLYGREIAQEYLKNFDSIDKILDLTHYEEIQGRILKLTLISLPYFVVVSAFDYAAWWLGYGPLTPLFYSLAYVFLLIKILTNLDLTVQIINVECRLRAIGDLLQECYESVDFLPTIAFEKDQFTESVNNKNWFYDGACKRAKEMKLKRHPLGPPTNSFCKIKLLTRCYMLIAEQCTYINRMFGLRILLNSLSLLIDMVRFLNVVVRIALGTQRTEHNEDSGILPALSTFMRFTICIVMIWSLVHHCEKAYGNTARIVCIADHILVNRNPDETLRSSVSELRNLVTTRPIVFTTNNFFSLGYPYLASTISVVCTYTIILLQNL